MIKGYLIFIFTELCTLFKQMYIVTDTFIYN